jgi:hypothetical protein
VKPVGQCHVCENEPFQSPQVWLLREVSEPGVVVRLELLVRLGVVLVDVSVVVTVVEEVVLVSESGVLEVVVSRELVLHSYQVLPLVVVSESGVFEVVVSGELVVHSNQVLVVVEDSPAGVLDVVEVLDQSDQVLQTVEDPLGVVVVLSSEVEVVEAGTSSQGQK